MFHFCDINFLVEVWCWAGGKVRVWQQLASGGGVGVAISGPK